MTHVQQDQTKHQINNLASVIRNSRLHNALLTGGGMLTWDETAGTLTWADEFVIEFPTINGNVRLSPGNSAGAGALVAGEALYVTIPALTTDDPVGAWVPGTTTTVSIARGSDLTDSESLFVLAVYPDLSGGDTSLVLRDGTILLDGVTAALGAPAASVSREVFVSTGATTHTVAFDYLPDTRQLSVFRNGILLVPGSNTAGPPDGYALPANADYVETVGGGSGGFYDQVTFQTGKIPPTADLLIFALNTGAQGPAGAAGSGGLDAAYGEDPVVNIDSAANIQTPIQLKESPTMGFTGNNYVSGARNPGLAILRSTAHPDGDQQGSVAGVITTVPEALLGGLALFDASDLATISSELGGVGVDAGTHMLYMGVNLGARSATPKDKATLTVIPIATLAAAGANDPELLSQWLQTNTFGYDADHGAVSFNTYGEIATNQATDFLRWSIFDLLLPDPGIPGTVFDLGTPLVIDDTVIEPAATFLGGFATLPYSSGADTIHEFFNGNQSVVAAGENPLELTLSFREINASGNREIHATYGSSLIGQTARVVLFFSREYAAADEIV